MRGHKTIPAVLAALVLVCACAGHPSQQAAKPGQRGASSQPAAGALGRTPAEGGLSRDPAVGGLGTYRVGERHMTFVEPAHGGPTGRYVGQRPRVTAIWYPLAQRSAGSQPAPGPFPLLMFAPGFLECGASYSRLVQARASPGHLVPGV